MAPANGAAQVSCPAVLGPHRALTERCWDPLFASHTPPTNFELFGAIYLTNNRQRDEPRLQQLPKCTRPYSPPPSQHVVHKSNICYSESTITMTNSGRSALIDLIESLPDNAGTWGPTVTTETTLNGVPYAPYSKGDKLGRMADWTSDSKDGRDGRGGRQQYNRNYRGMPALAPVLFLQAC